MCVVRHGRWATRRSSWWIVSCTGMQSRAFLPLTGGSVSRTTRCLFVATACCLLVDRVGAGAKSRWSSVSARHSENSHRKLCDGRWATLTHGVDLLDDLQEVTLLGFECPARARSEAPIARAPKRRSRAHGRRLPTLGSTSVARCTTSHRTKPLALVERFRTFTKALAELRLASVRRATVRCTRRGRSPHSRNKVEPCLAVHP
jgi:hypothetical protein